jgi:hypothetical protein
MVSLDIENAYDTVWIYRLLYKLISLKLPTYLIFILRAFLLSSSERCVFQCQKHSLRPTSRGGTIHNSLCYLHFRHATSP